MNRVDFIFGVDGHAGLSRRKAGELLKIGSSSIGDLIRVGTLFSSDEVEAINRCGIRGEALAKFCVYYSSARRATPECRQHCQELLKTEDFQALIDELAAQPQQSGLIISSQPEQVKPLVGNVLSNNEEPITPRKVNGFVIGQREIDGYINATAISTAHKKMTGQRRDVADWLRSKRTQESITHLSTVTGIPVTALYQVVQGGANLEEQGTWIHPRLAVRFAMWVSDEFGYMVEQWVEQWTVSSAGIVEQPQLQKPALPLPTIDEQLNTLEKAAGMLSRWGGLDDRTKLAFSDKVRNLALGNQLALSAAANTDDDREWTISDRVVVLGYPVQRNSVLSAVGLLMAKFYREKHGTEPITRIQYVDGAPRQVKSYRTRDLDILDKAIRIKLGEPPRFRLPSGQ